MTAPTRRTARALARYAFASRYSEERLAILTDAALSRLATHLAVTDQVVAAEKVAREFGRRVVAHCRCDSIPRAVRRADGWLYCGACKGRIGAGLIAAAPLPEPEPEPEYVGRCRWCEERFDLEGSGSAYCSDFCSVAHRCDSFS